MNFMQTNLFENDIEINKDISALIWNKKLNRIEIQKKLELINTKRQKTAAFYTDSELVDNIIQELPSFSKLKKMTILEPSVGVGSFLWEIAKKYKNKKINYILVDINKESLLILKELLKRFPIHNASFEYINTDFLNLDVSNKKIDIVIGNPPFGKINKNLLAQKYISNNLATIFLEKILKIKSYISLVLPKSILNAPNFNQFRRFIKFYNIKSFIDFGESGFKGVKIETINIMIDMKSKDPINNLKIISNIDKTKKFLPKNYVIDDNYPYWLIYRNKFFDSIAKKLIFDQFFVFRDRQLTKKNTKSIMSKNDIWILRSRNFTDDRKIIHIDKYDRFISKQMAKKLQIYKFINKEAYLMPNLSYKPRSIKLPKNILVDGSLALLIPKGSCPSEKDLLYYSSSDFRKFYRIARNLGTRSLNIDSLSVFFFGTLKK